MRLAEFITADSAAILAEWDEFASSTLPAPASISRIQLRDHAAQLLATIAKDLRTYQSSSDQEKKAKGLAPEHDDSAANAHGLLRAQEGFDVNQMAAEYRALRACVLRLWTAEISAPAATDIQDMVRFNEAIDQALAESLGTFSSELERSRNLLLGMLGHDMRNPLSVILVTAAHLTKLTAQPEVSSAAKRLILSGARMKALLNDLVDFSRTRLGIGVNIRRSETDLSVVFREQIELLRTANPEKTIELDVSGDSTGWWDANRMHQVLGNLVTNAIKYGADQPVRVTLAGQADEVSFSVCNKGNPIAPEFLHDIFRPLRRGAQQGALLDAADEGMGLGLYITKEIVTAHAGEVSVHSNDSETCFRVRLPKTDQSLIAVS